MQEASKVHSVQSSTCQHDFLLRTTAARLVGSQHSLWHYASASAKENRVPLATPLSKRIATKKSWNLDCKANLRRNAEPCNDTVSGRTDQCVRVERNIFREVSLGSY